ncbi:MAG TPA: hypothetical protein VF844_16660 [Ktedonobacteraceae bacterium]
MRAKSRLMLSLVKQLLVVIEDIASYDKAIGTLFLTHPDQEIWSSLPRAGKRLAPRMLAEWGDDRTLRRCHQCPAAFRDRAGAVCKRQLRQSAQTLRLLEAAA